MKKLREALEGFPYSAKIIPRLHPNGYLFAKTYDELGEEVYVGVRAPVGRHCPASPRVRGRTTRRSYPIDASPTPIVCVVSDYGDKGANAEAVYHLMVDVDESSCLALGDTFSCFG